MKKIELLAPAKNLKQAITAINSGADAVYVGAATFGARSKAGNSIEDIKKIVQYAHKFNAKAYITINTLLNDEEILAAQSLVYSLYEAAVDAIIIQDMGLLELELPPIAIHASTQCHNNNGHKVEFLEKVGFQRAILARELTLQQIKKIHNKTNIELEAFIHGALCVSYSGQCYLSQAIGGRSGNKGECAQPCRKKYTLQNSKGKIISSSAHLLSLKDMNLSESLKDTLEAGVTSFKIEGRLKDENYIKNIVSYYRQALDSIIKNSTEYERSSSGESIIDFTPNANKTFNRGYTKYFIEGRVNDIASIKSPKQIGEKIGKVISVKNDLITINTDIQLNNGDGVSWFDENDNLFGSTVNTAKINKITLNNVKRLTKNTVIYRNYDHKFIQSLEKCTPKRKLKVNIELYQENNNLVLKMTDENNNTAASEIENIFEPALQKEKGYINIEKQIKKLGDTDFYAKNVAIKLQEVPFIPTKTLNELRRNVTENLTKLIEKNYKSQDFTREKNDFPYPNKRLDYKANINNKYAKKFYERHGCTVEEMAAEAGTCLEGKAVMTTKHCLRHQFGLCKKESAEKHQETLYIIDEHNKKYKLNFNCKNCEMSIIY